jgi:uncharacterized protein YecT (DUF1311 family)
MINQITVFFIRSLMLVTIFYNITVQAVGKEIDNFVGKWQVQSVYIDNQRTSFSAVSAEDPMLIGRTLTFTHEKIAGKYLSDPGCERPVLIPQSETSLNKLLALTTGQEGRVDLAKDYLLEKQGNSIVIPFLINCSSGIVGPSGENTGNWLAMLDKHTMLINWDDNSLLKLQKVLPGTPVEPSFNCQDAENITAKTICKSFDLAAWDRSIAAAYEIVEFQIKNIGVDVTESLSALNKEQREWLAERNQCKDDRHCIEEKMVARVSNLMAQAN